MQRDAEPIMLADYPRAIVHIDGDAFFTSVEQALNPSLRGKPVATGKERGIIACASYEAKALGIKRGIPLFTARKICPNLILLPSDYESYGLFSKRMFDIMRRFTPDVEEYSIDEAFADITGMRRVFHSSYEEIARRMQNAIRNELGLTASVGLSLSKGLAKLCSKFRKPDGFTAVPGPHILELLRRTPMEKVWGFGQNSVQLLKKHGMENAADFVMQTERWTDKFFGKPGREIWNELRGNAVLKVSSEPKTTYATIIKSRTFTPPSSDLNYVFAQLSANTEAALEKARRYRLRPGEIATVLRRQNFQHDGMEARLNRASSSTVEILPVVRRLFDSLYQPGILYRSTMIVLLRLESDTSEQYEFFHDPMKIEESRRLTAAMDAVNEQYGRRTLSAASILDMQSGPQNQRAVAIPRLQNLFPGESDTMRIAIPRLEIALK